MLSVDQPVKSSVPLVTYRFLYFRAKCKDPVAVPPSSNPTFIISRLTSGKVVNLCLSPITHIEIVEGCGIVGISMLWMLTAMPWRVMDAWYLYIQEKHLCFYFWLWGGLQMKLTEDT